MNPLFIPVQRMLPNLINSTRVIARSPGSSNTRKRREALLALYPCDCPAFLIPRRWSLRVGGGND
jgi:hypothetical protein